MIFLAASKQNTFCPARARCDAGQKEEREEMVSRLFFSGQLFWVLGFYFPVSSSLHLNSDSSHFFSAQAAKQQLTD